MKIPGFKDTTSTAPKNKSNPPIVASTQDHLDILDIRDDFLILKSGTVAAILETSAVNFYLLSQTEQESKIMAFAGLLNSLNFHMQVLIHTQRVDIAKYVKFLDEEHAKSIDPKKKYQIEMYTQFVKNLIQRNNVLDKKFYVVIPYTTSLTVKRTPFTMMIRNNTPNINIKDSIENARSQLEPKKDVVMKLLAGMGIRSRQLNSIELTKLFYTLYNNERSDIKDLSGS